MAKIIEPLFDRVVVVPLDRELESEGILLPESSVEEQKLGAVVFVGTEAKHVQPGDTVLFGIYAGVTIEIEGRPFIVMHEPEIQGKIKDQ